MSKVDSELLASEVQKDSSGGGQGDDLSEKMFKKLQNKENVTNNYIEVPLLPPQ